MPQQGKPIEKCSTIVMVFDHLIHFVFWLYTYAFIYRAILPLILKIQLPCLLRTNKD